MVRRPDLARGALAALALLGAACDTGPGQKRDADFDASVAQPAYDDDNGPSVLFDEAHRNRHRADGTYRPFVDLITNDGYRVTRNDAPFTAETLSAHDVLVIVNAMGANEEGDSAALTDAEADAVVRWVVGGGSLLLVTDHYPFGEAVRNLADRLAVVMHGGFVEDSANHDPTTTDASQLLFSRENGLLADHPITNGRDASERVERVVTFTGQSLFGPGTPLLRLGSTAVNRPPVVSVERDGGDSRVTVTYGDPVTALGYAQAHAFDLGRGRVVVLGEAAMFSAQVDRDGNPFGMNVDGNDNRQLVLNTMHWLSGLIPSGADKPAATNSPAPPASGPGTGAAVADDLRAALERLVSGASADSATWFSPRTAEILRSVVVDANGQAVVDFVDLRPLIPNASSSAGSEMLLRQVNATVFSVDGVASVEYRMAGSCELLGEWLQYGTCLRFDAAGQVR